MIAKTPCPENGHRNWKDPDILCPIRRKNKGQDDGYGGRAGECAMVAGRAGQGRNQGRPAT